MAGAYVTLIALVTAADPSPPPGAGTPAPGPAVTSVSDGGGAIDPPIVLSWIAPEGCPAIDELRDEIRRLAGSVPAPADLPEANAVVRRIKDTWQLTLTTRSGALGGERKLAAGDCAELMRAAALVLALMINPHAGAPAPPPPAPPPPPPPPVEPAPAHEPERPLAIGAVAFAGTGMLPGGLAPGVGLRVGWGARVFALEARGHIWTTRSAAGPAPNPGGSFDFYDFGVAACAAARREHVVSPGACAGLTLFRSEGRGFGVSDPDTETAWWSGAFVEGDVRFRPTRRQALRVGIEGIVPFGRPTFALRGIGPVWKPSPFGVRGTLGWELHF